MAQLIGQLLNGLSSPLSCGKFCNYQVTIGWNELHHARSHLCMQMSFHCCTDSSFVWYANVLIARGHIPFPSRHAGRGVAIYWVWYYFFLQCSRKVVSARQGINWKSPQMNTNGRKQSAQAGVWTLGFHSSGLKSLGWHCAAQACVSIDSPFAVVSVVIADLRLFFLINRQRLYLSADKNKKDVSH